MCRSNQASSVGSGHEFSVNGSAGPQQRVDVVSRDASLFEDRKAALTQARGMTSDFQGGAIPSAGDAGISNPSFGRMRFGLEEFDRCEVRIVDQVVGIVHRCNSCAIPKFCASGLADSARRRSIRRAVAAPFCLDVAARVGLQMVLGSGNNLAPADAQHRSLFVYDRKKRSPGVAIGASVCLTSPDLTGTWPGGIEYGACG